LNLISLDLLYTEQCLEQVCRNVCLYGGSVNEEFNTEELWHINFCRNRFVPVSPRRGCYYDLQSDFDAILRAYRRRSYQMITINDHDALADDTSVKGQLQALLAAMYPQKSSFEK
jgi:hypothetical protein